MKLLMLSHGYPPTVSGVTLVVQKISRALVRKGHQVTVLTASERRKPYSAMDEGVQLVRIHSIPNLFWREGPIPYIWPGELRRVIADVQPDLIHTHENAILSRQLLRLRRELPVPLVSSCYFLPRYVTHYLRWGKPLEVRIREAVWKSTIKNLNQYDHVIFSTKSQQNSFVEHGLVAPSIAISNGLDTTRYNDGNNGISEVEARYRLPDAPRVLFVSRLAKDKKIDLLIEAMPRIHAETGGHLLLAGRGDDRERLEQIVHALGLQEIVHFLGFVPEADLPAIYRASDLFAIASICEVQSIPALQAAATGLPLVAADAAALPEIVHSGVNGFLVPPEDREALSKEVIRILKNPELAAAFGRASLEISRQHAEEETFNQYETFYREVIAKGRVNPLPLPASRA
jgi:glycosyltransferase involved in cell wall biosynthesis